MFNIAISGLQAANTDLSMTGNNIANASSIGFKSSRAVFADMYASQSTSDEIGMGVKTASVDQQFSQGTLIVTGNTLDMAIDGDGFFGLDDGGSMVYTRAGSFNRDVDGYIVNSAGQKLIGYQTDDSGNVTSQLAELQIDTANMEPSATTEGSISMNLNADSDLPSVTPFDTAFDAFASPPTSPEPESYNSSTAMTVYDSLGNSHTLTLYYVKTGAGAWDVHAGIDGQFAATLSPLSFTADGLVDTSGTTELTIAGHTVVDGAGVANGAANFDITIDFSDTTQFGNPFTVHSLDQNGYAAGDFSRVEIDDAGIITSFYSNGEFKKIGQVALYDFDNPQGLNQLGDVSWSATPASGPAIVGVPQTGNLGGIQSAALEQSNVDLTEELVNLILAQRNYQANAQSIRAADTVTQTIMNIR